MNTFFYYSIYFLKIEPEIKIPNFYVKFFVFDYDIKESNINKSCAHKYAIICLLFKPINVMIKYQGPEVKNLHPETFDLLYNLTPGQVVQ